jgi:hypothetical protein
MKVSGLAVTHQRLRQFACPGIGAMGVRVFKDGLDKARKAAFLHAALAGGPDGLLGFLKQGFRNA